MTAPKHQPNKSKPINSPYLFIGKKKATERNCDNLGQLYTHSSSTLVQIEKPTNWLSTVRSNKDNTIINFHARLMYNLKKKKKST